MTTIINKIKNGLTSLLIFRDRIFKRYNNIIIKKMIMIVSKLVAVFFIFPIKMAIIIFTETASLIYMLIFSSDPIMSNDYTGDRTQTIFYEEDLIKGIKNIKKFVSKVKARDDYARGYEDGKVIMLDVLDIIELRIKK